MHGSNRLTAKLAAAALCLVLPTECFAASYSITDLGVLGIYGYAFAINENGQVTGTSRIGNSAADHGFLYSDGVMYDLGTFGGANSAAFGINNQGQVVGGAQTASGEWHPFLYDGTMRDLIAEDGMSKGSACGINSLGQVTMERGINDNGQIISNETGGHGYLYSGDQVIEFQSFGGTWSEAHGINSNGDVVGQAWLPNNYGSHPFLYDGEMHDLGTLGGTLAAAFGINDNGQVVGTSSSDPNNNYAYHAFLYDDGRMLDLNSLVDPGSGWTLEIAYGINSRGQIVGRGLNGGNTKPFLLTPVPEPTTLTLAIAGTLLILVARGRGAQRDSDDSRALVIIRPRRLRRSPA